MKISKEYKDIETFLNEGKTLACHIMAQYPNASKKHLVQYARGCYEELIRKRFFIIGTLPHAAVDALSCNDARVKFSVDNLLKNMLEHSEINFDDYKNLSNYINNARFILQKDNKHLIYFVKNERLYSFVIKTTKDKKENYLTTFHIANNKQLKKDLIRYTQIKR